MIYLELTKPRITAMVLITTVAGFLMAWSSHGILAGHRLGLLILTFCSTGLIVGGANALNQYLERESDSLMKRTRMRPLPQKRVLPRHALLFGIGLSIMGVALLALTVNTLSALLALMALVSYVMVYTPLKKITPLNTWVGAVPGAVPPVLGYIAAGGTLGREVALLFAILFLWQLPHFLAIAWIYREDYARAGFAMLTVMDPEGDRTSHHILFFCGALLAVSLLPSLWGLTGRVYFCGALILGLAFSGFGMAMARVRSKVNAWRLFIASDLYLPSLLILMLAGKH